MEEFSIREATNADVSLISVVGATTFYEAYFEQDEPSVLADYIVDSFSPDKVRREMADRDTRYYIACLNDRGIGYARLIENSRLECVTGNRVVELKRIYLVERFWGKGFGRRLLYHCIEHARRYGADTLWLTVWWQNPRGIAFYEQHGFVKVGKLNFKFGEFEETNEVMQLTL